MHINKKSRTLVRLFVGLLGVLFLVWVTPSKAASFTKASMRLGRMTKSVEDNQVLVVVDPATVATEGKVVVTFSSGFSVNSTASNIHTSTESLPATYEGVSLNAWPSIGATAASVDSKTVTFASGDLTVGTLYGFYITTGITNPSSAASDLIQIISTKTEEDAAIDSSTVALAILDSDQVVITATVSPTFSFALSANSDAFTSNLSSTDMSSTMGVTATIATNAANGWVAWLKSANGALSSVSAGETIDSAGSVDDECTSTSNGSNTYQLDVNLTTDSSTGDGTVTVAPEYDCGAAAGGTLSTSFQEIGSSSGTTGGDVITMVAKATINAAQGAATDYTDTWTVIGAGNF